MDCRNTDYRPTWTPTSRSDARTAGAFSDVALMSVLHDCQGSLEGGGRGENDIRGAKAISSVAKPEGAISASDPTQLNSTQLNWLSYVGSGAVITATTRLNSTQLNSTGSGTIGQFWTFWIFSSELSWVVIVITTPDPTQLNWERLPSVCTQSWHS